MACLAPHRAEAQARVGGRVVRISVPDSIPLSGAVVVLHRIGSQAQGPIDSARTDAAGRVRFSVTPDTSALFLISSLHDGIEYFSRPARPAAGVPDTALTVVVADTSSAARVAVAGRFVMIGRPEQDGRRPALDLLVLQNRGDRTRVAADSTRPVLTVPLPVDIGDFQAGESEFPAAALGRRGDSLTIAAPITPGQRQLMVTYTFPRGLGTARIPLAGPTDTVGVLLEEPTARVTTPGFTMTDTLTIDTRTYRRWVGSLPAGGDVQVKFLVPGEGMRTATLALAALLGAGLLLGSILLLRRRAAVPSAAVPRSPTDAASLIDALARLDAEYAGRQAELGAEAWSAYVTRRAGLKAALDAAMAARPPLS